MVYQLVAWTDKGQVKLLPELLREYAQPYIDRIESLKAFYDEGWDDGQGRLTEQDVIALSRSYEAYGRFLRLHASTTRSPSARRCWRSARRWRGCPSGSACWRASGRWRPPSPKSGGLSSANAARTGRSISDAGKRKAPPVFPGGAFAFSANSPTRPSPLRYRHSPSAPRKRAGPRRT